MLHFCPCVLKNCPNLYFAYNFIRQRRIKLFFGLTVFGNCNKHMNGLVAKFAEGLLGPLALNFLDVKIGNKLLLHYVQVFQKCAYYPDSNHIRKGNEGLALCGLFWFLAEYFFVVARKRLYAGLEGWNGCYFYRGL